MPNAMQTTDRILKRRKEVLCTLAGINHEQTFLKGPCAMLVLRGRALLSECANKPYMKWKQHENIGKAMAANYYGSSVQRDLEDHLFISGRVPASW